MSYLLDTNIWVALLRSTSQSVSSHFQRIAPTGALRTCSVVIAELRHGALKSAKPVVNRVAVDAILAPYPSLSFDDAAADHYASIRCHFESIGQLIGPLDIQIAAIALTHGCTLVTHNISEFSRVPGLLIEDWQV